ncbi:Two-component response regulator CreC [Cronobacter dublinensis 582]|nr:Two-component response regulator CreC [Cronobacter dublinensis 582]
MRYADSGLPDPGSSELRRLAQALENMRVRLEGKNYIEQYVHALTHELKSPLAGIRGAAEILREAPPPAARRSAALQREYFAAKRAHAGAGGNPAAPGEA